MAKNIAVLGSTGSIGVQTLEVAQNLNIKVSALSANKNIDLLESQARKFMPRLVAVPDASLAAQLKERLNGLPIEVYHGVEGLKAAASIEEADTVVSAIVGIAGLIPTLEAIKSGKAIALANKETLVTAGLIVMAESSSLSGRIFPLDFEHSAIY